MSDNKAIGMNEALRLRKEKEMRESYTIEDVQKTSVEVIIPTLNEELTIGGLIDRIRSLDVPVNTSILVIDGGSTDGTIEVCKRKNVRLVTQRGRGKGKAMREAADETSADIIVFIDADATYPPEDMPLLLQPLLEHKADMVVGSRIASKREKGAIQRFNVLGNKIFNKAINFAMGSSVTDSLSGYRALHTKTFKELVLFSDSFEIEVEMTVEALARGLRISEVPIGYGVRTGAPTKLDPFRDGIKIARSLLFILMNVTPLKFFGLIFLGFIVVGFYPAYFVLHEKITVGEITSIPAVVLSSLLFVTGAIALVVGILSELVVRSRRRLEYLISKKLDS
ncbi:MAG: glycosyltransferase [Nitrososphaeraceae archaeon]|nr:glycosyltransferase [Nitrososphaeraceae archaeon]